MNYLNEKFITIQTCLYKYLPFPDELWSCLLPLWTQTISVVWWKNCCYSSKTVILSLDQISALILYLQQTSKWVCNTVLARLLKRSIDWRWSIYPVNILVKVSGFSKISGTKKGTNLKFCLKVTSNLISMVTLTLVLSIITVCIS